MMKRLTRCLFAIIGFVISCMTMVAFIPAASAKADDSSAVTSSRSFKKVTVPRRDLLTEGTSSQVDKNSDWGGIEHLDVPQTQSQAEKDAQAQKEAQDAAAQAASRSASRQPLSSHKTTVRVNPPNGQSVSSLLTFADQFVGVVPYHYGGTTTAGWDCSGFVQYVFGSVGVSLPRTSGQQAHVGQDVADLGQAEPGDIIANDTHAAIYIGNGMVINAESPETGTRYNSLSNVFSGSYSIRRVL